MVSDWNATGGFEHIRLDTVNSTNDALRQLVLSGEGRDGLVVSARCQTRGRGRSGRGWASPEGNLYCSILVALERGLATAAQVSFVAAVAVAEALQHLVPTAVVRLKWPNDVLVGAADGSGLGKVSGLLLEVVEDRWLIVGLGVNVALAPAASDALFQPHCLRSLGFQGSDQDLLAAVMAAFHPVVQRWRIDGLEPVLQRWLGLAHGVGGPIRVRLDTETLDGVFRGLDAQGAMVLDQNGVLRSVLAGDVFFPDLS